MEAQLNLARQLQLVSQPLLLLLELQQGHIFHPDRRDTGNQRQNLQVPFGERRLLKECVDVEHPRHPPFDGEGDRHHRAQPAEHDRLPALKPGVFLGVRRQHHGPLLHHGASDRLADPQIWDLFGTRFCPASHLARLADETGSLALQEGLVLPRFAHLLFRQRFQQEDQSAIRRKNIEDPLQQGPEGLLQRES